MSKRYIYTDFETREQVVLVAVEDKKTHELPLRYKDMRNMQQSELVAIYNGLLTLPVQLHKKKDWCLARDTETGLIQVIKINK